MRLRQLRASIRQVRHANLLRALLNDVVDAAPRHRRQIFAIGIARPILNRAGHAHVPLSLRKPRRDLRVVDGPVLAKPIAIRRLEINIPKSRRRPPPEIGLPASRFAPLPIPIRPRRRRVRNVVLKQIPPFAVFRFLDGIRLLMRLPLKPQRIAIPTKFQIERLSVQSIVLRRISARPRIQRTQLETRLAQQFHRGPAARPRPHYNHIKLFRRRHRLHRYAAAR